MTKLPKDMSKLRKLRSLNLRHNNFPSVQGILPSLTTLPALRSLHVDSTTDAEEEAVIIGLPNMSVFNGTNLHGDENEHEHIYSRTMQERRDSRDEAALNKQVEERHEKQEVYRFNETKPNITANDPVPPPPSVVVAVRRTAHQLFPHRSSSCRNHLIQMVFRWETMKVFLPVISRR